MELFKLNINNITQEDIEEVKLRLPNRYQKSLNFKVKEDKLRSIGSSLLILKAYPGIKEEDIAYNQFGKPLLMDGYFNISHDQDLIILVKDDSPIGIDVANIREREISNFKKIFSKEEFSYINNDINRFYICWCKKESILKLFGFGITKDLSSVNTLNTTKDNLINYKNKKILNTTTVEEGYVISISKLIY